MNSKEKKTKTITKLWILIIVLIILTPIGLIVPEYFKAGGAWGEWGTDEIKELIGYMPRGLAGLSSVFHAPIPDYTFKGWGSNSLSCLSISYIISAIFGILAVAGGVFLLGKFLSRKD